MRKAIFTLVSAIALFACAREDADRAETTDEEAPPADVFRVGDASADSDIKLYVLDCGRIDVLDLAVFDRGGAYEGRTDTFADSCFLLRHPKGDLLWDTGLPDALNAQAEGVTSGPFRVSVPTTLGGQLAALGLQPTDIEFVAISHSHFDHAGNGNAFAGSTFIVHAAERADAETFANYSALETAKTIEFDSDYDVFGDGSATIVPTPGHTPGHSVLLVRLKNWGPILLSGDLYHLDEAREKRTVPVFNADAEETLRSMEKFEALAEELGARVVIQHESEDLEVLPKPPEYLD